MRSVASNPSVSRRFLIVEDNHDDARAVAEGLRALGHLAAVSHGGFDALQRATLDTWDLIILDRVLPQGMDGLSVLVTMRSLGRKTPVLVLSAMSSLDERVRCLKAGCDDYLVKPFAFQELEARAEALMRRSRAGVSARTLQLADLQLNLANHSVERGGRPIALKPREFQLLAHMMMNQGQVLTRSMLLEAVWGYQFDPQTNLIEAQISRLRAKLDAGGAIPLIHTVRGTGYRMAAQG